MPCAASPPSAFCQEKVTTSSLAQSRGCANAAEVASQMVRPSRVALIQSAFGTRTPEVVPFQVKTTSDFRIDLGEVGDLTVSRVELGDVLELQFLDDVADPALAKGFPGERGDGPRTQHRPQRHLDRAGIGGRHDADAIISGHFEHFARQIDRELELGLADLRAMRTAERCVLEILGIPSGALGAGAGGKMRHVRPRSGLRYSHRLPFQIVSLPLGRCPAAADTGNGKSRQGSSGGSRAGDGASGAILGNRPPPARSASPWHR